MKKIIIILLAADLLMCIFLIVFLQKREKLHIVHIESYNEMIPEEYIDDYLIITQTGELIQEFQYNVETKEITEVSQYYLNIEKQ